MKNSEPVRKLTLSNLFVFRSHFNHDKNIYQANATEIKNAAPVHRQNKKTTKKKKKKKKKKKQEWVTQTDQSVVFIHCYTTETCLYNLDSLKPHFYIVKLGCTWGIHYFLISTKNIESGTR